MTRLVIMVFATLGSWLGWWAGEQVGLMTAVAGSGVGGLLGVWAGWRIDRDWLQ